MIDISRVPDVPRLTCVLDIGGNRYRCDNAVNGKRVFLLHTSTIVVSVGSPPEESARLCPTESLCRCTWLTMARLMPFRTWHNQYNCQTKCTVVRINNVTALAPHTFSLFYTNGYFLLKDLNVDGERISADERDVD